MAADHDRGSELLGELLERVERPAHILIAVGVDLRRQERREGIADHRLRSYALDGLTEPPDVVRERQRPSRTVRQTKALQDMYTLRIGASGPQTRDDSVGDTIFGREDDGGAWLRD